MFGSSNLRAWKVIISVPEWRPSGDASDVLIKVLIFAPAGLYR